MGYALRLQGGSTQHVVISAQRSMSGPFAYSYKFKASAGNLGGSYFQILGLASTSRNICQFADSTLPETTTLVHRARAVSSQVNAPISITLEHEVRYEFDGVDQLKLYVDGALLNTFTGANRGFDTNIIYIGRHNNSYTPSGYDLLIYDINFEYGFTYNGKFDPSLSNGTGLTLINSSGSNHGTLVGFSGDDSQWVYYESEGGGEPPPVQETTFVIAKQRNFAQLVNAALNHQVVSVQAKQLSTAFTLSVSETSNASGVPAVQKSTAATLSASQFAISWLNNSGYQPVQAATLKVKQIATAWLNGSVFQPAAAITLSAKQTLVAQAVAAFMRTTAVTLAISDDLTLTPSLQRSTAVVLIGKMSLTAGTASAYTRTYASQLQISTAMMSMSISALQRTRALMLTIAEAVKGFNPEKITANLITDRLNATRLTNFFNAQLISNKHTATKL